MASRSRQRGNWVINCNTILQQRAVECCAFLLSEPEVGMVGAIEAKFCFGECRAWKSSGRVEKSSR